MDMPFGRYRGRSVTELDDDYLDWLLTRCDNVSGDLRAALEAEEARRNGAHGQGLPVKPPLRQTSIAHPQQPEMSLCAEIIQLGFLQRLTTIHTKEEATAVTAAVDYMRKALGL